MSRYLRIATAVLVALLGMALVAFWARSYYRYDYASRAATMGVSKVYCYSFGGVVGAWFDYNPYGYPVFPHTGWASASDDAPPKSLRQRIARSGIGFGFAASEYGVDVMMPHWFLAASSLAMAAVIAVKRQWRFTVRGLLMTTTVIAAMLGLVVYAV